MSFTNFIVISKLNLIIEVSRNIDFLDEYRKEALDVLCDEEEYDDVMEASMKEITVGDFATLVDGYKTYYDLSGSQADHFLLYWLESNNIEYRIESEFNINLDNYPDYTIRRM